MNYNVNILYAEYLICDPPKGLWPTCWECSRAFSLWLMGEGPAIVGDATPVLVFLQESHVEQGRQQHPSVASPSSSFLPFLRSCSDFLWWLTVSVSQVNPFFPNLAFGHMVFITAVRDPTTVTTSCFIVRSLGILENKWTLILHTLSTPIVSLGQLDTLMF